MSKTQKDQIESTGNEQCKDSSCTLHHLGTEPHEDNHSALLSGEEEKEYYDLILCFKDGNYHIADSVAAIDTETLSSSVQLCGSDGSDGGTFYTSEQETGSNVSATDEQEQLEESVLDLHLHVAAESERGSQMGGKRHNSPASFSWTGSRALSSSWGDFVRNLGSMSNSSSDASRQSTVRSSFTFPTATMAWNETPARLPNPRSGNPRKHVARKLLFLCCRF